MLKKHIKYTVCCSHIIGFMIGVLSGLTLFYLMRPKCKSQLMKNKVKRAFRNIENRMDI